jgi:hypothetical protein
MTADGTSAAESKEEEEEADNQEEEKDDGSPEDEVPVGQECHGMRVAISGTKKDLGMSQDDVADLVTEHGGEVMDSVTEANLMASFVVLLWSWGFDFTKISAEAELKKKKLTKKVQTAIDSIPIFSVEFLQNLVERKEEVSKSFGEERYLLRFEIGNQT